MIMLQGVNTTRRFLLEWLSFLHRYTPVRFVTFCFSIIDFSPLLNELMFLFPRKIGLLEHVQTMNQRPPTYFGRCDLETLLGSSNSADWVRISELLLGPTPDGFIFTAKHKSNSYSTTAEMGDNEVSNG